MEYNKNEANEYLYAHSRQLQNINELAAVFNVLGIPAETTNNRVTVLCANPVCNKMAIITHNPPPTSTHKYLKWNCHHCGAPKVLNDHFSLLNYLMRMLPHVNGEPQSRWMVTHAFCKAIDAVVSVRDNVEYSAALDAAAKIMLRDYSACAEVLTAEF